MIGCIVGRSCQGRVTPKNQSSELRFRALLTEDGTQRLELGVVRNGSPAESPAGKDERACHDRRSYRML